MERNRAEGDAAIRAALERYLSAIGSDDAAVRQAARAILADDLELEFPQSGERFVGLANAQAMRDAYPAAVAARVRRIRGSGDSWTGEITTTYDGERPTFGVALFEFRDGKIARETIYFGEPFQPPAWRARWVAPSEE